MYPPDNACIDPRPGRAWADTTEDTMKPYGKRGKTTERDGAPSRVQKKWASARHYTRRVEAKRERAKARAEIREIERVDAPLEPPKRSWRDVYKDWQGCTGCYADPCQCAAQGG